MENDGIDLLGGNSFEPDAQSAPFVSSVLLQGNTTLGGYYN